MSGRRRARCNPPGYISFLLLPELIAPLERLTGQTNFSRAKFLEEAIDSFDKLPRREQDERCRAMSRKWPRSDPDYRSHGDRMRAIVGNAILLHWIESAGVLRPD